MSINLLYAMVYDRIDDLARLLRRQGYMPSGMEKELGNEFGDYGFAG